MNIIGIAGAKRVGKDTFYHVLKARQHPVSKAAIADSIKADLSDVTGLSGGSKEQLRPILQLYGDIAKQLHGQDYWIDRLSHYIHHLPSDGHTIITDVRFPSEAKWIKEQGGIVVVVKRPIDTNEEHSSETEWRNIEPDYTIENNQGLSHYAQEVVRVYQEILSDGVKLSDVVTAEGKLPRGVYVGEAAMNGRQGTLTHDS